jgi:hypothetical protein
MELRTTTMETTKKNTRAEQARINGAKSKGPKTPEGRLRIAAANRNSGVSLSATLLPNESQEAYNEILAHAFDQLRPQNLFEAQLVEELVDCNWQIMRLKFTSNEIVHAHYHHYINNIKEPVRPLSALTAALGDALKSSSIQDRVDRKIRTLTLLRSRILRDLLLLRNELSITGITQEWLKTNEMPTCGPAREPKKTEAPEPAVEATAEATAQANAEPEETHEKTGATQPTNEILRPAAQDPARANLSTWWCTFLPPHRKPQTEQRDDAGDPTKRAA